MYRFSKSTLCFYIDGLHRDIPLDAVKISEIEYAKLFNGLSPWKKIDANDDGFPVIVDIKQSVEEMMNCLKSEMRSIRAPMLDALTGIAGRATRSGNDDLATEADALAVNLLAITDDAALNAAKTYEAMQAAGVKAYKRIASTASPELSVVFREITGA